MAISFWLGKNTGHVQDALLHSSGALAAPRSWHHRVASLPERTVWRYYTSRGDVNDNINLQCTIASPKSNNTVGI